MTRTSEYRVRAVTRYVVTHYEHEEHDDGRASGGCGQLGEFPNIDQADTVAKALQAADAGSTFATIAERREPGGVYYAYDTATNDRMMEVLHGEGLVS